MAETYSTLGIAIAAKAFSIQVVGIQEKSGRNRYGRVIDSHRTADRSNALADPDIGEALGVEGRLRR